MKRCTSKLIKARNVLPTVALWAWALGCTPPPAGAPSSAANHAPAPAAASPADKAKGSSETASPSVSSNPTAGSAPGAAAASTASPTPNDVPVYTKAALAARAAAEARLLGGNPLSEAAGSDPAAAAPNTTTKTGDSTGGAAAPFIPIENEAALQRFHAALRRLAAGDDPDGKVRIAAYGASHTQAGYYPSYLRHYLQHRFGNGGQGFVPAARINEYYRRPDYHLWSDGYHAEHVQPGEYPRHGRFGLMGVALVAESHEAFGRVLPRDKKDPTQQADRYELFYSAEPEGGDLFFSLNWKPVRLEGDAAQPEPRYHSLEAKELGWHQAQVAPVGGDDEGPIRVYGFVVERSTPGVVVDTLGINGARAAYMLRWNQPLWFEHLRRRDPDLVTLAYGTNEAVDVAEPIATYEKNLRRVLTRLREALPEASCLLIGPGDFPQKRGGVWQTRARLLQVIAVQRKLAPEFQCGFWDTFAFMGGEGSMVTWVAATPPLAASDHIHFTPHGYVKMGMALGDALMRRYDAQQPNATAATAWGY